MVPRGTRTEPSSPEQLTPFLLKLGPLSAHKLIHSWLAETNASQSSLRGRKRKASAISTASCSSTSSISEPTVRQRSASEPADNSMPEHQTIQRAMTPPAGTFNVGPLTPAHSTSEQSGKSSAVATKNAGFIDERLKQHGIVYQAFELDDKYPVFAQKLDLILGAPRQSAMRPASAKAIRHQSIYYENMNEDTYLYHMLPLVLKPHSTVAVGPDEEEEQNATKVINPKDGEIYRVKSWFTQGVVSSVNQEFAHESLPNRFPPDLKKQLQKDDKMTNGRPDRCFGLKKRIIPRPANVMLCIELENLLNIMGGMHHPFCIIEGKSNKNDMGVALIQCRRGGATMVHAHRQLLAMIGEPDVQDADTRTFVFTITVNPTILEIYVCWAEVQGAEVVFHTNHLRSFAWKMKSQLPEMRQQLHNILSWGCTDRLTQLQETYQKMYAWQQAQTKRQIERQQQDTANKKRKTGSGSS